MPFGLAAIPLIAFPPVADLFAFRELHAWPRWHRAIIGHRAIIANSDRSGEGNCSSLRPDRPRIMPRALSCACRDAGKMPEEIVPVLVVGGGPVGLALAGDLGWRGISCTLIERSDGSIYQPRMDLVGVRTMEFCRGWGIVPAVEGS